MEHITYVHQIEFAEIFSRCPDKNFYGLPYIFVEPYNKEYDSSILTKFSIPCLPEDVIIISASLKIYVAKVGRWHTRIVTPYAIKEDWKPRRVTWNNRPLYNKNLYGDSLNIDAPSYYKFNITDIVQAWYNQDQFNYGIILTSNTSNECTHFKENCETPKMLEPIVEIVYCRKNCCCKHEECTKFVESTTIISTNYAFSYALLKNTSVTKTVTYLVENMGETAVSVKLQISPNGSTFAEDNYDVIIEPGMIKAIVPYIFAKYTRIGVKNIISGESSEVKIWYQAQK